MAKRFFVDDENISINGSNINVYGPEVHHINVLRHKIGDIIKVNRYVIKILEINELSITGKIQEIELTKEDASVEIVLYQSYVKADKMEYITQKAVELGVKKIVPFLSKNCVVKLDDKAKIKKVERLNKISSEASKQCNRQDIAEVKDIIDIKQSNMFVEELNKNDINILAYEKSNNSIKELLNNVKSNYYNKKISIGIIIGPEGGFDASDIQVMNRANNIYDVSLGDRILRAETASLNLLSILNYVFDN